MRRMSRGEATAARPGWVYLVGAGPGDPALITLRGARLLESADLVLHDELVAPELVARAREDAEVRSVGKRGSGSSAKQASQAAINAALVAGAQAGKSVVRLKGGDPFLFGRGAEEAMALRAAGVPFAVVPGVSAPFGATAYAGIPLTHRDAASSVTFVTAITRDGAPFDWTELRGSSGTLCVFMGTRCLEAACRGLIDEAGRAPDTPAALASWISYPRQRVVSATLADLAQRAASAGLVSPSLLVVGKVVALRELLRWFDAQPLFGKRVLVTRPVHQAAQTADMLRERGAEPVLFPTIAIEAPPDPEPTRRAVAALATYDLVAFTSDNAVDWLWRALEREGLDARAFGGARVAAIGPATAGGLVRHGIRPDIVAATYVAEHLAEAILAAMALLPARAERRRVLLPRALVARDALPRMLAAAGLEVDVVPVYRTVTAGTGERARLRALMPSIDAVLLTSSSTADKLNELLGSDARELLARCLIASIGPVTTATASALGWSVGVTADVSTSAGLIDALENAFRSLAPTS
jgi:uroporphyrinogen III methyltransferase/synthase